MSTHAADPALDRIVHGAHHDPHSVLGPHLSPDGLIVRTLRPWARSVVAVVGPKRHPLTHEREGVFAGLLPYHEVVDYRIETDYGDGPVLTDDPYRHLPTVGQLDQHLISEGRHERLWDVLGAHLHTFDSIAGPVTGVSFAVWAPNAQGIRVVGDFNHWDGRAHPMRSLGSTGVWELFVPGIGDGTLYKYEILGRDGVRRQKADPMAQATEVPPQTASKVFTSQYTWGDADWLAHRESTDVLNGPMSVYEVHLASWRPWLTSFRAIADELASYCQDLGFTHVELMPVMEHPYGGSWGYQVTSYFAPTSRFGTPDDVRYLVDRLHQVGVGVLLDWVPAHFPKDAWALARFDGAPLYEPADPRRGEHPDWGTYVFDYGRREVRNFLVASGLYWLEEFHADGLRVDAVASMLYLDYSRQPGEWLPNQYGGRENLEAVSFLQEANATAYKRTPGIAMIAEESTAWPGVTRPTHLGGLGFGLKWNMGWMHDSLGYIERDPVHRSYHHHELTFSMMYAWTEQFTLPLSHDEVVHGKGSLLRKIPGDRWQQLATLRAYYAFMWGHPGKKLLFMGGEFGQDAEWSESRGLDWWLLEHGDHRGLQACVADLNRVYRDHPALWERDNDPGGFGWIDANDAASNVYSFLRWSSDGSVVACIVNFAGHPHDGYRVGLPFAGRWAEILNTDSEAYGGSGVGNLGVVDAHPSPWHGQPASVSLRVPPLGALYLAPE
jgi:1,4-alpha-glucan branching enzyme